MLDGAGSSDEPRGRPHGTTLLVVTLEPAESGRGCPAESSGHHAGAPRVQLAADGRLRIGAVDQLPQCPPRRLAGGVRARQALDEGELAVAVAHLHAAHDQPALAGAAAAPVRPGTPSSPRRRGTGRAPTGCCRPPNRPPECCGPCVASAATGRESGSRPLAGGTRAGRRPDSTGTTSGERTCGGAHRERCRWCRCRRAPTPASGPWPTVGARIGTARTACPERAGCPAAPVRGDVLPSNHQCPSRVADPRREERVSAASRHEIMQRNQLPGKPLGAKSREGVCLPVGVVSGWPFQRRCPCSRIPSRA